MAKRTKTTIEKEIADYKELIASNAPQDEKDFAKGEIKTLEEELANFDKKPAKSAKKVKKKKPAEQEADTSLKECKELIKRNSPPKAEPVHHTKATRFDNAMSTITNVLLEGQTDQAVIKDIEKEITCFTATCKKSYLEVKNIDVPAKIDDKFEKALEKIEQA